jgi:hypothetical protein
MEMSQGNSLLNKNVIFVFFHKIREHVGRTDSVWGFGSSGRVEDVGKGGKRVNMVQILCKHVCNWKNETG